MDFVSNYKEAVSTVASKYVGSDSWPSSRESSELVGYLLLEDIDWNESFDKGLDEIRGIMAKSLKKEIKSDEAKSIIYNLLTNSVVNYYEEDVESDFVDEKIELTASLEDDLNDTIIKYDKETMGALQYG